MESDAGFQDSQLPCSSRQVLALYQQLFQFPARLDELLIAVQQVCQADCPQELRLPLVLMEMERRRLKQEQVLWDLELLTRAGLSLFWPRWAQPRGPWDESRSSQSHNQEPSTWAGEEELLPRYWSLPWERDIQKRDQQLLEKCLEMPSSKQRNPEEPRWQAEGLAVMLGVARVESGTEPDQTFGSPGMPGWATVGPETETGTSLKADTWELEGMPEKNQRELPGEEEQGYTPEPVFTAENISRDQDPGQGVERSLPEFRAPGPQQPPSWILCSLRQRTNLAPEILKPGDLGPLPELENLQKRANPKQERAETELLVERETPRDHNGENPQCWKGDTSKVLRRESPKERPQIQNQNIQREGTSRIQGEEIPQSQTEETPKLQRGEILWAQRNESPRVQGEEIPQPQIEETLSLQRGESSWIQKNETLGAWGEEIPQPQRENTPKLQEGKILWAQKNETISVQEEEILWTQKEEITQAQRDDTPKTPRRDISQTQKETSKLQREISQAQREETPKGQRELSKAHKRKTPQILREETAEAQQGDTCQAQHEKISQIQERKKQVDRQIFQSQGNQFLYSLEGEYLQLHEGEDSQFQKEEIPKFLEKETPQPQGRALFPFHREETRQSSKENTPLCQRKEYPQSPEKAILQLQRNKIPQGQGKEIAYPWGREIPCFLGKATPQLWSQGRQRARPGGQWLPSQETKLFKTPAQRRLREQKVFKLGALRLQSQQVLGAAVKQEGPSLGVSRPKDMKDGLLQPPSLLPNHGAVELQPCHPNPPSRELVFLGLTPSQHENTLKRLLELQGKAGRRHQRNREQQRLRVQELLRITRNRRSGADPPEFSPTTTQLWMQGRLWGGEGNVAQQRHALQQQLEQQRKVRTELLRAQRERNTQNFQELLRPQVVRGNPPFPALFQPSWALRRVSGEKGNEKFHGGQK